MQKQAMSIFTGLAGRKALVTGSVTGIGRAVAEALAQAGAGVVAHGLDGAEVRDVAAQWRAAGFDACESDADLAAADGVSRLKEHLAGWGAPDILVINASIEIAETWENASLDAMKKQGMVNIWSSLLLVQTFLPAMLARDWGRVLGIGSIQESRPNAHHIAYAATKSAQTNMILNMARNVRAPNVTFNVLKPGVIATSRNSAALADADRRREILARTPLGQIGEPGDCVGAALLLCSEEGRYMNGAEIHVDGGYRL
jgi:NAD(P)-dependent dehydrogenase (short-subunit alcohol dehydrogenase family)